MVLGSIARAGEITEIVGRLSSGRTSLLMAALRHATHAGAATALVDVDDAFDAVSASRAGVELGLRERPCAVVTGTSPATRIVEANAVARALGVHPPMTETEARTRCPELTSRPLADEVQATACYALLDAALTVSPRVEDAG